MKIAIVIAGEPRFSKHMDNFIHSLQGVDSVDWYFYLWGESHIKHLRMQVPADWVKIHSREWAMETIQNNLPAGHRVGDLAIGDQQSVVDEFGSDWVGYKQFYSLHQADLLRRNSGIEYDLVVRGRVDLNMTTPINLPVIKTHVDQDPNIIFIPGNNCHGPYSINDQLAISSPKNISLYSDLILYIKKYNSENHVAIHQETQMGYHLTSNGINIQRSIQVGELRDPNNTVGFGRWD
jgi:hypothetical protein